VIGRAMLGGLLLINAFQTVYFSGHWHFLDYYHYSAMRIDSYGLLPLWPILWIALIQPWLELVLGVLLISGVGLRWTGLAGCAFMFAFNYTSVIGQWRNTGDGFSLRGNLAPSLLIRDGSPLLIAIAVTIGAFLIKKRQSTVSS
jgi:hypothetical protein